MFDDILKELVEQRDQELEKMFLALPPGMYICMHEEPVVIGMFQTSIVLKLQWHAVTSPEACDWRGNREVYGPRLEKI
jgi:hypothetical protein